MADIICTVPDCEAQAVLVLNGQPICRPHCEEFMKHAEVLDVNPREVSRDGSDELRANIAGLLPCVVDAARTRLPVDRESQNALDATEHSVGPVWKARPQ